MFAVEPGFELFFLTDSSIHDSLNEEEIMAKKVQKQKPGYVRISIGISCVIVSFVLLFVLFAKDKQTSAETNNPGTHTTTLKSILPIIKDWDGDRPKDVVFSYEDVGEWETNHRLITISVQDLPQEETMVEVATPLSYAKVAQFPRNDYVVTGLPWEVLITNNHNRGLYEVIKNDPKVYGYTFINWDYHDDVIPNNTDFVFSSEFITVANWVGPTYFYGRAKDPLYWFNCFAQPPDTEYPYPGTWDMKLPLRDGREVQLPGEIINVKPNTDIAIEYFDKTIREAEDHSVWLSLCGDCFSKPGEMTFDQTSFRAELLKSILQIANKYPEKIAFIHFARSPDYSGDAQGLNAFFVKQLQSL